MFYVQNMYNIHLLHDVNKKSVRKKKFVLMLISACITAAEMAGGR